MCFRFREGLPKQAFYLKQPIRSLQDRSRDYKIDIYRCGSFSPSSSLIPRKRELIEHAFLIIEMTPTMFKTKVRPPDCASWFR